MVLSMVSRQLELLLQLHIACLLANEVEVETLLDCNAKYTKWSGQKLNSNKSSIFFSKNLQARQATKLMEIIGLKKAKLDSKYLGLPLFNQRSKKKNFQDIKEKILDTVAQWKAKVLSQARRTIIIRTIASIMPMYQMSSYLLTKEFCKEMDAKMKDLWWGFKPDKRHYTSKSWEPIFRPKLQEGLCLRRFMDINRALIAKLGWNILTEKNKLWVQILKAKYMRNEDLMHTTPKKAQSWTWQSILQNQDLIEKGRCYMFNNGRTINIQEDPWLPNIKGNKPHPNEALKNSLENIKVANLIDHDNKNWKREYIYEIFDTNSVEAILNTRLQNLERSNELIWTPNNNGKFTVKSAYWRDQKERFDCLENQHQNMWKKLQKLKIQDRQDYSGRQPRMRCQPDVTWRKCSIL